MVKISIIIPVYNSETYLSKCLDSVINQTLNEIEVICINDASMDNSLKILNYYSNLSNKVKIIDCKENKGQGNRRNLGINQAKGKYILFLDSDDWLELDACEKLFKRAEKTNVDLLLFDQIEHHENNTVKKRIYFKYNEINNPEEFIFDYTFNNNMLVVGSYQTVWGKLHRTSFLKENKILFPNTRANEDVVFNAETVIKAERIAYFPEILYHYRRTGQISTQNSTIYTRKGFNLLPIFSKIEHLLKIEGIFSELEVNFLTYKFNEAKIRLNSLNNSLSKEFYILLKKDFLRMDVSEDILSKLREDLSIFYNKIISSKDFDSFMEDNSKNYEIELKDQILHDMLNGNYLNLCAFEKIYEDKQLNASFKDKFQILEYLYNIHSFDNSNYIFNDSIYKQNYLEVNKSSINPLSFHVLFGLNENKYKIKDNVRNVETVNKRMLNRKIKKFSELGLNSRNRDTKIIVSLTSFPERINEVKFTIYSLLNQKLKPDELVLWLASDEFKNKEEDLPISLLNLTKNGLSIRWYEKNIKSYKKLIPSLKSFPNSIIVTADDDIFYPENWLFDLFEEHKRHPLDVICTRSRKIFINEDNTIAEYNKWKISKNEEKSSFFNFFTGAGGVLYPPNSLDERVLNEELAMELCPSTDDIWFWAMTVLNGRKIKLIKNNLSSLTFLNPFRELNLNNQKALWKVNVGNNENDIQIKILFEKFPELTKILGVNV